MMKPFKSKFLAGFVLLAATFDTVWADQARPLPLGPFEISPSGEGMFMIGGGGFNSFESRGPRDDGASALLNLEYRFGEKFAYLGFAVGGLVTSESARFVYLGNYADIRYKNYIATPLLSVGAYQKGAGPDLGGTLQFRSSITLAYEFEDGSRMGVRIAHISNADIHDDNPGENEILMTYGFRF